VRHNATENLWGSRAIAANNATNASCAGKTVLLPQNYRVQSDANGMITAVGIPLTGSYPCLRRLSTLVLLQGEHVTSVRGPSWWRCVRSCSTWLFKLANGEKPTAEEMQRPTGPTLTS